MALTNDIKTLLSGVSNVYIGSMPITPDNSVCIYPSGGYPRDLTGTFVEEPTVQIRVRNTVYTTGETLCNTIKDALHAKSSAKLLMIEQQGDTLNLGRDESNRSEWTLNFRCYYRR